MPRYFFNRIDAEKQDEYGIDLADLDEARAEAVVFLEHTLLDNAKELWNVNQIGIEVSNAVGDIVAYLVVIAV